MRAVVLGATAGVGRALAEQLAARGATLVLAARDEQDLNALSADLRLRCDAQVHVLAIDIAAPAAGTLDQFVRESLGEIDALFMIAGISDRNDRGMMADGVIKLLSDANFTGPARAINLLLPLCAPGCHIVLAGSVAAIRPRGSNGVYGASKLALEYYGLALRYALGNRLGSVCCYRLGYIRTAMTFGQRLPLPPATPEQVADTMIRRLGKSGVAYYPGWWRLVAFCLLSIPDFLFKKLAPRLG